MADGVGATALASLLDELPDGPVVVDAQRTWSKAEIVEEADALVAQFADAGIGAGDAIGVSLPNTGRLVAALFAVWRAGAIYIPVNPRLTQHEVDHVVEASHPAALLDHDGLRSLDGARAYDADVALVQFTSGTTGRPKAVLLRHDGVLSILDGVVGSLRGSSTGERPKPQPNLVPVSLSLWAGIYQVLFAFRVGAPVVLMDGFDTRTFAALVAEHEIRSVVLPPAAMTMLSDDEAVTSLAPLRYVRSITAPLSPLQAHRFRDRFGVGILNCYGQTEIGGEIVGWTALDWREHGEDKLGAVGRPHAGVEVRTDAETGELQVLTPALSGGYADGSDLSDRMTEDGWFRTGDVGRVDDDGFVWIEGRLSDSINRGGLKVFPAEVEEVLRLGDGVADAAVVGVPDDRLGEVPWAFVVGDGDWNVDAIVALCREHLAPYKIPVRFEAVDALPRNEVGKVLKPALQKRAHGGL